MSMRTGGRSAPWDAFRRLALLPLLVVALASPLPARAVGTGKLDKKQMERAFLNLQMEVNAACDKNRDKVVDGKDWAAMKDPERLACVALIVTSFNALNDVINGRTPTAELDDQENRRLFEMAEHFFPQIAAYYDNPRNRDRPLIVEVIDLVTAARRPPPKAK